MTAAGNSSRRTRIGALAVVVLGLAACDGSPVSGPPPLSGAAGPVAKGPEPAPPQYVYDVDAMPKIEFVGPRGDGPPVTDADMILIHYVAWAVTPTGDKKCGGTVPVTWSGTRKAFEPLPADPEARNAAPRPLVAEPGREHTVEGFRRTLLGLRIGDHARALVPAATAYGDRGFGASVPGRTDIRYEIWVLSKVPKVTWTTVRAGEGPRVIPGWKVMLHSRITLPDGTVVDDTNRVKPGATQAIPATFEINGNNASEGLDAIVPSLRVGDLIKATIPWALDLGPEQRKYEGVVIPAMTDMTYEIEVVSIPPIPTPVPPTQPAPARPEGPR